MRITNVFLTGEKKDEEIEQENQSHVRVRMRVTNVFFTGERKAEEIEQENQSHVRVRRRVTEYGFVNSVIASASVAISRIY